jgi:DNA processing protein
VRLAPRDEGYPPALLRLDVPPTITTTGALGRGRTAAIVGAREAGIGSLRFAFKLAYHLARAGVTVISGGAHGVDRVAHEGALRAGGATWLVSPGGRGVVYPPGSEPLHAAIAASEPSRMIWPFRDGSPVTRQTPRRRNGVLVALSEHVVVVEAAPRSGSRNAARWGRRLGRPVFVVPGPPWEWGFLGSIEELMAGGASALWAIPPFFEELGLPPPEIDDPASFLDCVKLPHPPRARRRTVPRQTYSDPPLERLDPASLTEEESLVFSSLFGAPMHQDEVVDRTGLPASAAVTALLTLSLKDVVVEGPDGFFRRRTAP